MRQRTAQLYEKFAAPLHSFDLVELGLVTLAGPDGERPSQGALFSFDFATALGASAEERLAAREGLDRAGYLRPGRLADAGPSGAGPTGAWEELQAVTVPDGQPVVLFGDYALVCLMKSAPCAVVEVRPGPPGAVDPGPGEGSTAGLPFEPVTIYTVGTTPLLALEEQSAGGSRRKYLFAHFARLMVDVYEWSSMPDAPDPRWGASVAKTWDEAKADQETANLGAPEPLETTLAASTSSTFFRLARPAGTEVEVKDLACGVDARGFWLARGIDPTTPAERVTPFWLQVQLAVELEPPPSCVASWSLSFPA
ncbi:MAG TPA: hypothetical protein VFN61_02285 [Acidimicrobiales bacterium]|nr:hypothetical protein [Acidimicrobiales bacterium]